MIQSWVRRLLAQKRCDSVRLAFRENEEQRDYALASFKVCQSHEFCHYVLNVSNFQLDLHQGSLHPVANSRVVMKVCVRGEMDQIIVRSFKQRKARYLRDCACQNYGENGYSIVMLA